MTPQLEYSLKKATLMVGIAAAGAFGAELTGILNALGVDQVWVPVAGAIVAGTVRTFEGWRDGLRAEHGDVIPEDVTATIARKN
jgi:hypothetical protein